MKSSSGYAQGQAPADMRRYLSLKLKTGWRFDSGGGQFVSTGGQRFAVRDQLPKGSEIVPSAATLAGANPATLSEAERDLARYFQLILPKGAAPERYLPIVELWDAVEAAALPPQVSLP